MGLKKRLKKYYKKHMIFEDPRDNDIENLLDLIQYQRSRSGGMYNMMREVSDPHYYNSHPEPTPDIPFMNVNSPVTETVENPQVISDPNGMTYLDMTSEYVQNRFSGWGDRGYSDRMLDIKDRNELTLVSPVETVAGTRMGFATEGMNDGIEDKDQLFPIGLISAVVRKYNGPLATNPNSFQEGNQVFAVDEYPAVKKFIKLVYKYATCKRTQYPDPIQNFMNEMIHTLGIYTLEVAELYIYSTLLSTVSQQTFEQKDQVPAHVGLYSVVGNCLIKYYISDGDFILYQYNMDTDEIKSVEQEWITPNRKIITFMATEPEKIKTQMEICAEIMKRDIKDK